HRSVRAPNRKVSLPSWMVSAPSRSRASRFSNPPRATRARKPACAAACPGSASGMMVGLEVESIREGCVGRLRGCKPQPRGGGACPYGKLSVTIVLVFVVFPVVVLVIIVVFVPVVIVVEVFVLVLVVLVFFFLFLFGTAGPTLGL